MPWFEKKFNKALIWLIIGTTIAWVAGAKTPKGKRILKKTTETALAGAKRLVDFLQSGLEEMTKSVEEKSDEKSDEETSEND